MNRDKGSIYMSAAAAGSRQLAAKVSGAHFLSLDYATWHASLRGHNDWGSSAWPAEVKQGGAVVAVLYVDTPYACRKAA